MTGMTRQMIGSALLLSVLVGATIVAASSTSVHTSNMTQSRAYLHSYNLDSRGLALEGYCPVSYFTDNSARQGRPEYSSTFNNVDYYFSSSNAKQMFDRNPMKYIPAFGGWCAFGMAIETKLPIDPTAFKIVDGRLFVFLRNPGIDALAKWNDGDEDALVAKAEAHWKKVAG